MNIQKLKDAESRFLETYPGGFSNPEIEERARKHKTGPLIELAQSSFAKDRFARPELVVEAMAKIVSRSSMVSIFEKPKFRDYAASLSGVRRSHLARGLEEFLYGDQKKGFETMVEVLKEAKLAKWSLVTLWPFYYNPTKEVFVKPTTTKHVIEYFEIQGLVYKPAPTYEFYKAYRTLFNKMKKEVDRSFSSDNAHFSGFLMISMGMI